MTEGTGSGDHCPKYRTPRLGGGSPAGQLTCHSGLPNYLLGRKCGKCAPEGRTVADASSKAPEVGGIVAASAGRMTSRAVFPHLRPKTRGDLLHLRSKTKADLLHLRPNTRDDKGVVSRPAGRTQGRFLRRSLNSSE